MPRRLNRKNYGWSYTYGKGQRVNSEQYKENFEKTKWDNSGTDGWEEGKNQFGRTKRKVFK